MNNKLIRIYEVLEIKKKKKTSFYKLIKREELLKPIKIGGSSLWSYNNLQIYIRKLKNM